MRTILLALWLLSAVGPGGPGALAVSAAHGDWTAWSDRAQERLADLLPEEYAPPREEIRGRYQPSPRRSPPRPPRRG